MRRPKLPVINCHTHVFLGDHVPPDLAKTYLPWPLYKIFNVNVVLRCCRFWFLSKYSPAKWKYLPLVLKGRTALYFYRNFIRKYPVTKSLVTIINLILSYHAIVFVFQWLARLFDTDPDTTNAIQRATDWLQEQGLLLLPAGWLRIIWVAFVLFFIAWGRRMIFFIAKKLLKFLSILPDRTTIGFLKRYINIGRFAYYKMQGRIFFKLRDQYDPGTRFVILPMDMEFMGAGDPKATYESQMRGLWQIKSSKNYGHLVYPFLFVDPRRKKVGDQPFFSYTPVDGKAVLNDCFVKHYMENLKFSGFKIYPALGYYPFDEDLLPVLKYAADNGLPIMTHAIKGTIFYRGRKDNPEWDRHPIFKEGSSVDAKGLLLPELKNEAFINNFTHPLNYLCLVEEKLLRIAVSKSNTEVQKLFGYNGLGSPLTYNLSHLKLCFGHFGGEDQWLKYFEKDRDNFTNQLKTHPGRGMEFIGRTEPVESAYERLKHMWQWVDWYSIICSMMIQSKNLYADISYIIHDPGIVPLLKETLHNPLLKRKVLFGTDFYVVRNHKSEKEMLANIRSVLSEDEFDFIARINPDRYLKQ